MRKKSNSSVECLDLYEEDDDGFIEGDIDMGKAVASFSFGKPDASQNLVESKFSTQNIIPKDISTASNVGSTSIADESFSIKRGYQFKPSTIRKLYELKTLHPNVDVYLNIILDEAIQHFYNYIVNEKGSFTNGRI